ncbi:Fibrous sheath-interacting protein [Mactra antiquata]
MERLTLNRRQKTTGDRIDCIPAGDGLPVWTTISLDAKLPMMQNPKGSVILYTTKLSEPKHRCKQEFDFDLRDPNGQYISNEYQPLHDPHLRSHFNSQLMRRHLIKRGFISEDGKVLCSLKEFNQYRQYLRHIYFLEIANERKEELTRRHAHSAELRRDVGPEKQMSKGTLVRRRLQQQRERDLNKLKSSLNDKASKLETRLKAIREEMTLRERKQREDAERRQMAVFKNQQDNQVRSLMTLKRWRARERLRTKLLADRETQKKIQTELQCMEKWNARKKAQTLMLEKNQALMKQEGDERAKSINAREQMINRKRSMLEKKIEKLKQTTREEKQKRDEHYFKRLDEKLASGDYRIWTKRKERKKSPKKTFLSTWKLQDVLKSFEIPDKKHKQKDPVFMMMLNEAIDDAVDIVTDNTTDEKYKEMAKNIVDEVLSKVKNDLYPQYLSMLDTDLCEGNDAMKSKSVRFSAEEAEEIKAELSSSSASLIHLKPVAEHVLTPVASQLEIAKLEAEAILGSPEVSDKTSSVTFVETLLLRLLDDLNSGKLSKDEIMKLASYSMDIIQAVEIENQSDHVIIEESDDTDAEGPYLAASSSSVIAKKMVDFTLSKILSEVKSGSVHHEDIASLTVSLMDNIAGVETDEMIESDSALDAYIDSAVKIATSTAADPREDSPVCDALLDNFMVTTLRKLIHDLEDEILTREEVQKLAASLTEETQKVLPQLEGNIEKQEDVQNVLHELLEQLQSGTVDFQTMYQVVFAIVCSYNTMKSEHTLGAEEQLTALLKDLLITVEQKVANGELDDIDINIIQDAASMLANTSLDLQQIEKISKSISKTETDSECKITEPDDTYSATKIVIEAVSKLQLVNAKSDQTVRHCIETVAKAVIDAVKDTSVSPTFVDIFVTLLQELKQAVESIEGVNDASVHDIVELINRISSNQMNKEMILEIASTVVNVVRSPVKSQSSFAASLAVKDSLKAVLNDVKEGNVNDIFLQEMATSLSTCLNAAESTNQKTSSFLTALSSFLRNVLDQLSFKVQTGEMTEEDIIELTNLMKQKNEKVDTADKEMMTEKETSPPPDSPEEEAVDLTYILHHIQTFIYNAESSELSASEMNDIGIKLIECGKKLVHSRQENVSVPVTPCTVCTEVVADEVVEEVIRNLQIEIESGLLSKETLKEVTKVIIDSASASDIANGVVNNTIRGITRDVDRGYQPDDIQSIPTMTHSPSASTVASHIVLQTIHSIGKDISARGIPPIMISSLASTIISDLSGEKPLIRALPEEFQRFKPTIVNIVKCLKEDKVSHSCAESMFCLILEKYKACVLEVQEELSSENLSNEDLSLINTLVVETLDNVRRSVTKGRMENKAFSIPSMPHSDDTSIIANDVINKYIENIKTTVAEEKAMPPVPDKPNDEISLIDAVVAETMDSVRRSVVKGRMEKKDFSIPSMPHSEDSSVIAVDLIDACLQSIKRHVAAEKAMPPEPKHDLIDFILEIMSQLQVELADGTISNLSMAHFYKAISHDSCDMKTLEQNAAVNLTTVVNDIRQYREHSDFVHRILDTYLIPDKSSDEVFSDPLKAIEAILVNVSSEILTKFVKATLQTILMEMRADSTPLTDKTPSAYVLRSASSIIAENVIKEVVSRIRDDMTHSIHKIHGTVNKQDIERAASRLINESPRVTAKRSSVAAIKKQDSRQSVSSASKEVEDLVLETLHNIVSNLRLEQSMKAQKVQKPNQSGSDTTNEIEDFVLSSLQNIIADQQDIRTQMEMGVERTISKYGGSSIELVSGESKEAMTYVNEVLQHVIREMKEEIAVKEQGAANDKGSDSDSFHVQTMILDCLQKALSDTLAPDSLNAAVDLYSSDDIRKILLESVTVTVANIRDGKFSQHDVDHMYKACKRFLEQVEPDYAVDDVENVNPAVIIELMNHVKERIETLALDDNTFANISTQLATLGMESSSQSDKAASDLAASDLSNTSSIISELVQGVISRMATQLSNSNLEGGTDENNITNDTSKSHSEPPVEKGVSRSSSKNSSVKKDVNYNRRVSVSTLGSRSSINSSGSSTATLTDGKTKLVSTLSATHKSINVKQKTPKSKQKSQKSPTTAKKLLRRSNESQPVIRKSPMPSKPTSDEHKTHFTNVNKTKSSRYVHRVISQKLPSTPTNIVTSAKSPKSSKELSWNATGRQGSSKKISTLKEPHKPIVRKNKPSTEAKSVETVVKKMKPKSGNKSTVDKNVKVDEPVIRVCSDQPLELKSLCGAHRTKLAYKEVSDTSPNNVEQDTPDN